MARINAHVACPKCAQPVAIYEYPASRAWQWHCLRGEGGCGAAGTTRKGSTQPNAPSTYNCDNCGEPYQTVNPRIKSCDDCRPLRGKNHTKIIVKQCDWCDDWFVKRKTKHHPRFCTLACAQLHSRKQWRERRKNNDRPSFKIPRDQSLAVAYAYAYKCHLCRKLIDVSRKPPHPLSLTMDHLVPQSAGGAHDRTNLAPAHFKCNTDRAHTGPAQLQAFGAL